MTSTAVHPATSTSGDLPQVAVSAIFKHPHNPRHRAVADAELVDSVRTQGLVQPLILVPKDNAGPDGSPERYTLIAGHRRLDALKKAKVKTAPAVIRRDLTTEGQQIEAMLVENGRRQDLTPIEEAEGYAQLELLGYKAPAIAAAVGRDVKTVRARMKLLKLSPGTRTKIHAGQFNIEDAVAMTTFADDPDATKRLETASKSTYAGEFKQQLATERRWANLARDRAVTIAKLVEAGATELGVPKDTHWWPGGHSTAVNLNQTHSADWGQHEGCLGFGQWTRPYSGPEVAIVCTDPGRHTEQLDAEERKQQEALERERAERVEKAAAATTAAELRMATLLDLAGTAAKLDPPVRDLLRGLLPVAIATLDGEALGRYQGAIGVPDDLRWEHVASYYFDKPHNGTSAGHKRKLLDHIDDIATWTDGTLVRALVAYLGGRADANLTGQYGRRTALAAEYSDFLTAVGHPFSSVDDALRAEVIATEAAAS